MAEPMGLSSETLALATLTFQSSLSLYEALNSFYPLSEPVRSLLGELKALGAMLATLVDLVKSTSDADHSVLDLPLLRYEKGFPARNTPIRESTVAAESSGESEGLIQAAKEDLGAQISAAQMDNKPAIELLQAEVAENDQSFFRVLVDGLSIKYITVEPGVYSTEDMCFGPSLVSILPKFPTGDWNDGLVAQDANDGKPFFARLSLTPFPGVRNTWHGTHVDYFELSMGRKLRTGIYEAKSSLFDDNVVAKFARFPWEVQYIENETTAYQWISSHNIGPQFLGHLTEHGRVIGFLMERITGARHAGAEDIEVCREVLSRLHHLGVRHGDTNRFNFSSATLIDFDTAQKCEDRDLLLQESENLSTYRAEEAEFFFE
ncbi:alpha-galactosidase A precursor [Penicillium sp. IBT 18751x]|nr:alpha-galactosidase A precursor [Penicillium sp. IBT 18751x]